MFDALSAGFVATNEDFPMITQLVTSKDEYILFTSPDDLPGESPKDVEGIKK